MNQEINSTLYAALCACFGLAPASAEASALIRESYQSPENAPRPPRNTDVVYYDLFPDAAASEPPPAYAAENPNQSSHTPAVLSFSAYVLQVICYGPNAVDNARKIRSFLFLDGAGLPRSILRKAGIRLLPDPPEPAALHEPEGSLWRLRADLTIRLCREEKAMHPLRRGAVTVPPAVSVHAAR